MLEDIGSVIYDASSIEGQLIRHSYTLEEKIRILHGKYDISEEEARNLLKEDTSLVI